MSEIERETALLWSLGKAAAQLGDVSTRTVRRLIERGEIASVPVGRSTKVLARSVVEYVDRLSSAPHNVPLESKRSGGRNACRTGAKILPFGGSASAARTAKELDDLLKRPTERKRKR